MVVDQPHSKVFVDRMVSADEIDYGLGYCGSGGFHRCFKGELVNVTNISFGNKCYKHDTGITGFNNTWS
jgi:hypothetical protein